ncbi:MAG: arsenic efflux protein [Lachnospiraceae bacterium]|nr:arsenic efflux protein [Lachnospiraceae bacterium]
MIWDCFLDAAIDSLKILPFLFVTYIVMEYLEHRMEETSKDAIRKSGKMGPLFGALCGVVPQCGFSAAASNLYAGRVITIGTLIAVYLSTSDEMLPIFISEHVPVVTMMKILGLKFFIALIMGFCVDLIFARSMHMRAYAERVPEDEAFFIKKICESEQCKCNDGILKSAVKHTLHIILFLLLISFTLNVVLTAVGEESLYNFILNKPVIGVLLSGVIGLIPNCAASVIITDLYLKGLMSLGAMMSGLLVGAGVGLVVLWRVNSSFKDTLKVIGILYVCGISAGLLLELAHIAL